MIIKLCIDISSTMSSTRARHASFTTASLDLRDQMTKYGSLNLAMHQPNRVRNKAIFGITYHIRCRWGCMQAEL
jgi:hypothetical protein